jgi:hypothetical protein
MHVNRDLVRPYSHHFPLFARNFAHRALAAAAIFAREAADILRRFLPDGGLPPADEKPLAPVIDESSCSSSSMRCLIASARFSCTTVNVANGLIAICDRSTGSETGSQAHAR